MAEDTPEPLRLLAQDEEDLAVLSAHMQDAVVRVGDMTIVPRQHRFALIAARFDWLSAERGRMERRHAGLHFDNVLKAERRGLDPGKPDAMLNLLGILFEPTEAPAGHVTINFSGGATVRLEVECVEAQLRDLGSHWKTKRKPGHVAAAPDPEKD